MGSHSNAEPITRPSLLIRLRDRGDNDAWQSFSRLYGPLIFDFCRCRGLQESDAAEVMQETLLQITKSIQTFEYDRQRGRFRGWIGSIVHCKLIEFYRTQQRLPQFQETPLDNIAAATDGAWNEVWLEHVVQAALERVQHRLATDTWTAFEALWLKHRDPTDVARQLGRDVAWVYVAKSRGLSLLREEVSFLADEPLQPIESLPEIHHDVPNHAGATPAVAQ